MQLQFNKQSKLLCRKNSAYGWIHLITKIALNNLNTSTGKGTKLISNSIKIQGIKVISTNS